MGVESIRDIPDDFDLTGRFSVVRAACVQTGEPWYSPELRDELGKLKYPLYFADFETVNPGHSTVCRNASLRPIAFSMVGACAARTGRRARALRISCHRCERSSARVH